MMFRSSLSAIILLALVAACGDKAFAPGTAGDAAPPSELAVAGEEGELPA
jgi:hypothetical protein